MEDEEFPEGEFPEGESKRFRLRYILTDDVVVEMEVRATNAGAFTSVFRRQRAEDHVLAARSTAGDLHVFPARAVVDLWIKEVKS